jgi:transposase
MARHRIHSLAFKKQVVQEYAAGATLNGLAREHDLSRRYCHGNSALDAHWPDPPRDYAAAVACLHCSAASSLKSRSVLREMRWRWREKVL